MDIHPDYANVETDGKLENHFPETSKWETRLSTAVCYAALIVIPPLVRMFGMGLAPEWETWIYRALTFLVASCPCALVISIPLSFFAGIGGASKAGVQKTVMHTGDAKKVADKVAADLGVDQVYSELLPADKVEKVEELLGTKPEKSKLVFVGDGINDAPVLRRADIGIAMGAMGSDAAIEAADIVLMDDDPLKISKAIKISRKCLGIVYENIVFAIAIKLICLVPVALGFANMWLAVFADVGVMIIAVFNAVRALFVKNL